MISSLSSVTGPCFIRKCSLFLSTLEKNDCNGGNFCPYFEGPSSMVKDILEREDLLMSDKSLKKKKSVQGVRKPGSYLADWMPDLGPVTAKLQLTKFFECIRQELL